MEVRVYRFVVLAALSIALCGISTRVASPYGLRAARTLWSVPLNVGPPELPLQYRSIEQAGSVIAASAGAGVIGVNVHSGKLLWADASVRRPLVARGAAFYGAWSGGIARINAADGAIAWRRSICGSGLADIAATSQFVLVACSSPAELVGVSPLTGHPAFRVRLLANGVAQRIMHAGNDSAIVWAHEGGAMEPILISVDTRNGRVLDRYEGAELVSENRSDAYLFQRDCGGCSPATGGSLVFLRSGIRGGTMKIMQPMRDDDADVLDVVKADRSSVYIRFGDGLRLALYRVDRSGKATILARDVGAAKNLGDGVIVVQRGNWRAAVLERFQSDGERAQPIEAFDLPVDLYDSSLGSHAALIAASMRLTAVLGTAGRAVRVPPHCRDAALWSSSTVVLICGTSSSRQAELRAFQLG